jgi:hypothetical protein
VGPRTLDDLGNRLCFVLGRNQNRESV